MIGAAALRHNAQRSQNAKREGNPYGNHMPRGHNRQLDVHATTFGSSASEAAFRPTLTAGLLLPALGALLSRGALDGAALSLRPDPKLLLVLRRGRYHES